MNVRQFIFLLCLPLLLFGTAACNRHPHTVSRGFYYWKTRFALSGYERQRLQELQCRRIYLHLFDVDWQEAAQAPEPLAIARLPEQPDRSFDYVPVLFITPKVIARSGPRELTALAAHLLQLTDQIMDRAGLGSFRELQIDCDWTAGTQQAYFTLLQEIRRQPSMKNRRLSCTIRLHQIKYRLRSGIPPADKGLLMCYNLGDLRMPGARNSILDARLAKDYLAQLHTYPLPLDVALPLFRWCVQFRQGKMTGILRDVPPESLERNPLFRRERDNLYTSVADTFWQGYRFRQGDQVRAEIPDLSDIQAVARLTARQISNDSLSVILFHTDSVTLSKYSHDELEAIYNAYH